MVYSRPGEGSRPIFDREELKPRLTEERVIKLAVDLPERMERDRSPSRIHDSFAGTSGPPFQQETRSVEGEGEGDLRFRLMEKKSSEENKERMMADPNFVPQGRYYYEVIKNKESISYSDNINRVCLQHDNRERYHNRGRGFAFRGRGNYHSNLQGGISGPGGFRGNYRGGNSNFRESYRGSHRGSKFSFLCLIS